MVKGKSCNADKVVCDLPTPECPMGALPQVDDGCYTGDCLPIRACDWVPSCDLCGQQAICNITEGPGCTHHRCVPDLPECDGQPLCDCLGKIFCNPPHESCADEGGALVCSLP